MMHLHSILITFSLLDLYEESQKSKSNASNQSRRRCMFLLHIIDVLHKYQHETSRDTETY